MPQFSVYDLAHVGRVLYSGPNEQRARRWLYATRPGGRHALYVNGELVVIYSRVI